ncbi:hypothetical protein [Ancylothrix sp. D3o]|nr:hypothetical protein [Ancylothrix sp. D3o]
MVTVPTSVHPIFSAECELKATAGKFAKEFAGIWVIRGVIGDGKS